jgi:hypothetical protein
MAAQAHGQVAGELAAYDFSIFDMIGDHRRRPRLFAACAKTGSDHDERKGWAV